MKRKTRQIIFYFSVAVFLILSWLVVLFALGYKYDFVQNKFFKTGSFGIGVNVGADVYINDELVGTTSFLARTFSKSRLLPRTYSVRVQNEKYYSWQKLIDIEAGVFTDFPRVVLMPRDPNEEVIASSSLSGIVSIKFDPEKKIVSVSDKRQMEIIYLENGRKELPKPLSKTIPSPLPAILPTKDMVNLIKSPDGEKNVWFNNHEIWVSWLKDTNYQPYRKTGETELITRFSQKISDVQWYKDSNHLIADVGGILKFIEIDTRNGLNVFDISTVDPVKSSEAGAAGRQFDWVDGQFYYDKDTDAIFKFEGKDLVKISLK